MPCFHVQRQSYLGTNQGRTSLMESAERMTAMVVTSVVFQFTPPMEDVSVSNNVNNGSGSSSGWGKCISRCINCRCICIHMPWQSRYAAASAQSSKFSYLMQFMLMHAETENAMEQRHCPECEDIKDRHQHEQEETEERYRHV